MLAYCKSLPKAELHAHLNGSVSVRAIEKLIELRKRSEPDYKADDRVLSTAKAQDKIRTLADAFLMFPLIQALTQTSEAVTLATVEVISEFNDDNVKYLELRTTPRENTVTSMSKVDYIEAVLAGIATCSERLPIIVRLLLSIDRRQEVADASETVDLAIKFAKSKDARVVGVELSGDPKFDGRKFLPLFQKAREHGLKITLHLAESCDWMEELSEMLALPPDRIGHGTLLHNDPVHAAVIRENSIPLEICLTSNFICQTTKTFKDSHLDFWFSRKQPVCLCTDDQGVFDTYLSKEFEIASETFNLTKQDLFDTSLCGLRCGFAPKEELYAIERIWAQFAKEHALKYSSLRD
uniref:Adenosine deaminase domain-containing protein n=1 Tax=Plectus sambesii TaxID=2011161 RepID=A0A914WTI3_9BILA